MDPLLQKLEAEVTNYRRWADALAPDERSSNWEDEYPYWAPLYSAFAEFVKTVPCRTWNDTAAALVLFAIARNNEAGYLIEILAENADNLLCAAERATNTTESGAKWQIVVQLSRVDVSKHVVEPILLKFADDEDEYVRRRALMALADIGSSMVEKFIWPSWISGREYVRMAVLYALKVTESPILRRFLEMSESSGQEHLMAYAEQIQHEMRTGEA